MHARTWSIFLLLAGCDRPAGGANPLCGVAMVAGPTKVLTEFQIPNQTLSAPPRNLPERIVARFVAGPAAPAIVGRTDSNVVVGIEAASPAGMKPSLTVPVSCQLPATSGTKRAWSASI